MRNKTNTDVEWTLFSYYYLSLFLLKGDTESTFYIYLYRPGH